jgi:hypothetical protein
MLAAVSKRGRLTGCLTDALVLLAQLFQPALGSYEGRRNADPDTGRLQGQLFLVRA